MDTSVEVCAEATIFPAARTRLLVQDLLPGQRLETLLAHHSFKA